MIEHRSSQRWPIIPCALYLQQNGLGISVYEPRRGSPSGPSCTLATDEDLT